MKTYNRGKGTGYIARPWSKKTGQRYYDQVPRNRRLRYRLERRAKHWIKVKQRRH